jgi:hypothetical protein
MNDFVIDCSLALKFDLLIQRYAILILRYAAAQDLHTNSILKNPALCVIVRDQHICVNFSANSKQNSKIF